MDFKYLIYEAKPPIAYIKLNRPNKLNALHHDLHQELINVFKLVKNDDNIRVVILSGEGKAFCVGSDINNWPSSKEILDLIKEQTGGEYYEIEMIENLCKPVIAAIHGYCLGGGLELALACDIRIVANNSILGFPEVNWGAFPASGGTLRLPRLVGRALALELILTGKKIDAKEAFRIGLVNLLTSKQKLLSEAEALAKEIAKHSSMAIRMARQSIIEGLELPLAEAYRRDLYRRYIIVNDKERQSGKKKFGLRSST